MDLTILKNNLIVNGINAKNVIFNGINVLTVKRKSKDGTEETIVYDTLKEYSYSDITISKFSYELAPINGGTLIPVIEYSQTKTEVGNSNETYNSYTLDSDATITYSFVSVDNFTSVSELTGEVVVPSRGKKVDDEDVELSVVTVTVEMNGKSATKDFTIKQAKNYIVSWTNEETALSYDNSKTNKVSASGGTLTPNSNLNSATVTYASGESENLIGSVKYTSSSQFITVNASGVVTFPSLTNIISTGRSAKITKTITWKDVNNIEKVSDPVSVMLYQNSNSLDEISIDNMELSYNQEIPASGNVAVLPEVSAYNINYHYTSGISTEAPSNEESEIGIAVSYTIQRNNTNGFKLVDEENKQVTSNEDGRVYVSNRTANVGDERISTPITMTVTVTWTYYSYEETVTNHVTTSEGTSPKQLGNYITSITNGLMSLSYPQNISAGGSNNVTPTVTSSISTYTFTSGSVVTGNPYAGTIGYEVVSYSLTEGNGFSLNDELTGVLTAKSRGTELGNERASNTVILRVKAKYTYNEGYNAPTQYVVADDYVEITATAKQLANTITNKGSIVSYGIPTGSISINSDLTAGASSTGITINDGSVIDIYEVTYASGQKGNYEYPGEVTWVIDSQTCENRTNGFTKTSSGELSHTSMTTNVGYDVAIIKIANAKDLNKKSATSETVSIENKIENEDYNSFNDNFKATCKIDNVGQFSAGGNSTSGVTYSASHIHNYYYLYTSESVSEVKTTLVSNDPCSISLITNTSRFTLVGDTLKHTTMDINETTDTCTVVCTNDFVDKNNNPKVTGNSQEVSVKNEFTGYSYDTPVILNFDIDDVPCTGGSITTGKNITWEQIRYYNYTAGAKLKNDTINSGATVTPTWTNGATNIGLNRSESRVDTGKDLTLTIVVNGGTSASKSKDVYQSASKIVYASEITWVNDTPTWTEGNAKTGSTSELISTNKPSAKVYAYWNDVNSNERDTTSDKNVSVFTYAISTTNPGNISSVNSSNGVVTWKNNATKSQNSGNVIVTATYNTITSKIEVPVYQKSGATVYATTIEILKDPEWTKGESISGSKSIITTEKKPKAVVRAYWNSIGDTINEEEDNYDVIFTYSFKTKGNANTINSETGEVTWNDNLTDSEKTCVVTATASYSGCTSSTVDVTVYQDYGAIEYSNPIWVLPVYTNASAYSDGNNIYASVSNEPSMVIEATLVVNGVGTRLPSRDKSVNVFTYSYKSGTQVRVDDENTGLLIWSENESINERETTILVTAIIDDVEYTTEVTCTQNGGVEVPTGKLIAKTQPEWNNASGVIDSVATVKTSFEVLEEYNWNHIGGTFSSNKDVDGVTFTYSIVEAGNSKSISGSTGSVTFKENASENILTTCKAHCVASKTGYTSATSDDVIVKQNGSTIFWDTNITWEGTKFDWTVAEPNSGATSLISTSLTPKLYAYWNNISGSRKSNSDITANLTYSIATADKGNSSSIDPATGVITWNANTSLSEQKNCTVTITASYTGKTLTNNVKTATAKQAVDYPISIVFTSTQPESIPYNNTHVLTSKITYKSANVATSGMTYSAESGTGYSFDKTAATIKNTNAGTITYNDDVVITGTDNVNVGHTTSAYSVKSTWTRPQPTATSGTFKVTYSANGHTVNATTSSISMTGQPADTQNITEGFTWTSTPTSVATISETGIVTGVASGESTITATSPQGKKATKVINVYNDWVISVSPTSWSPKCYAQTSGVYTVSVDDSNPNTGVGSWEIESVPEWITLSKSSGINGDKFTIKVDDNTTGKDRTANIVVKCSTDGIHSVTHTTSVTQKSESNSGLTYVVNYTSDVKYGTNAVAWNGTNGNDVKQTITSEPASNILAYDGSNRIESFDKTPTMTYTYSFKSGSQGAAKSIDSTTGEITWPENNTLSDRTCTVICTASDGTYSKSVEVVVTQNKGTQVYASSITWETQPTWTIGGSTDGSTSTINNTPSAKLYGYVNRVGGTRSNDKITTISYVLSTTGNAKKIDSSSGLVTWNLNQQTTKNNCKVTATATVDSITSLVTITVEQNGSTIVYGELYWSTEPSYPTTKASAAANSISTLTAGVAKRKAYWNSNSSVACPSNDTTTGVVVTYKITSGTGATLDTSNNVKWEARGKDTTDRSVTVTATATYSTSSITATATATQVGNTYELGSWVVDTAPTISLTSTGITAAGGSSTITISLGTQKQTRTWANGAGTDYVSTGTKITSGTLTLNQWFGTSSTATTGTTLTRYSVANTTISGNTTLTHSSMTNNVGFDIINVSLNNGLTTVTSNTISVGNALDETTKVDDVITYNIPTVTIGSGITAGGGSAKVTCTVVNDENWSCKYTSGTLKTGYHQTLTGTANWKIDTTNSNSRYTSAATNNESGTSVSHSSMTTYETTDKLVVIAFNTKDTTKTKSAETSVTNNVESIKLTLSPTTVSYPNTSNASTVATYTSTSTGSITPTYTSATTSVATVSGSTISSVSEGTSKITATYKTKTDTVTLTVNCGTGAAPTFTNSSLTATCIQSGGSVNTNNKFTLATPNHGGTISYSIVSINSGNVSETNWSANSDGTITIAANVKPGTYTIVVKATESKTNKYTVSSTNATITVVLSKGTQSLTIDPTTLALTYPNSGTITASGNAGAISATSGNTNYVTVSTSGNKITVKPEQSTSTAITVTVKAASTDYVNEVTKTCSVTVKRGESEPPTFEDSSVTATYSTSATSTTKIGEATAKHSGTITYEIISVSDTK